MSVEFDALVYTKLFVRHSKLLDAMQFGHSCLTGRCPPQTLCVHERLVSVVLYRGRPAVVIKGLQTLIPCTKER